MPKSKSTVAFLLFFVVVLVFGIPFVLNTYFKSDIQVNEDLQSYVDITVGELKGYLDDNRDIYLLDVHTPEQEHISGTDEFVPFDKLAFNVDKLPKDKDAEIVVYCRSGSMSETASKELIDMGYTNIKNVVGGVNAWKAAGYYL